MKLARFNFFATATLATSLLSVACDSKLSQVDIPAPARGNTVQVPGVVEKIEVTEGDTLVTIQWSKPSLSIEGSISDYLIEYSSDDGISWVLFDDGVYSNTEATVTGLNNGAAYRFRVAAVNFAGRSAFAETRSGVIPFGLPGAPIALDGTPGNNKVTLTWTKPNSDGGRAIIDYVVEYSYDTTQTWITFDDGISTNPGATVTGLTNGASYRFRVAAVNFAGRSAFAETMSGVMPVGTPGVPINLIGTQGNTKVTLVWTGPTSDGGRSITDYVVEYSADGGFSWTVFNDGVLQNTGATVTGLTNGIAHRFRVAAVNNLGISSFQILSESLVPQLSPPDVPTGATVQLSSPGIMSSTSDSAWVSWSLPLDSGGSTVTEYAVEYQASGGEWVALPNEADPFAIIELDQPNTIYSIRVAAVNAIGRGNFLTLSVKSSFRIPSAPTVTSATPGSGKVNLVWQAPARLGGDVLVNYVIEYSSDYGKTWTRVSDEVQGGLSATVNGLVGLRDYSFRVAAKNSVGLGAFSGVVSATLLESCEGRVDGFTETRAGFKKFFVPKGKICEAITTERICSGGVFSPWAGPPTCSVLSRSASSLTKIDLQVVAASYNKSVRQYLKDEFDRYRPATFTTADLDLFSTYDSSLKQAVWSQNYLLNFDFSGHHWETEDNAAQAGTLITDQHLAHAAHWPLPVGKRIYFYTKEGLSVVRTVKEVKSATVDPAKQFGGDIAIAKLDSPVPDDIMVYPVLAPYADNESLNRDLSEAPYLMLNNNILMHPNDTRKVHWNQISGIWPNTGVGSSTGWMSISGTQKLDVPSFVNLTNITGGSGKPNFIVVEGVLVLMSTNTYAGYGSGPFYGAKASQDYIVNTTIPSFAP